jgi:MFS family permease
LAVLVTTVGLSVFQGAAMPLHMYVFPKERYGQFCGALAMLNALASMLGGLVAGGLTSLIQGWWGDRIGWAFAPIGMSLSLALCLALLVNSRRLWGSRPE